MIRPAFIDEVEWAGLTDGQKSQWAGFCRDTEELLKRDDFRRFMFVILNDSRFCGTEHTPIRGSPEMTFHAVGVQDAGRAIRLVLQSVSPKRWMQLMHDAFNATKETPQNG